MPGKRTEPMPDGVMWYQVRGNLIATDWLSCQQLCAIPALLLLPAAPCAAPYLHQQQV